jgi:predicted nuclease of restriction endonuclease-like (RecB) superfamily
MKTTAKKPARKKVGSLKPGSARYVAGFDEIVAMIEQSRHQAARVVNAVLVDLYWRIGEYLSRKIEADGWGAGTVADLSAHVQLRQPGIRGFSPQNLWRMRQFVEAWRDRPRLSALLRELQWTQHLIILGQSKRPEEQEFYLRMAIKERWSSRELERQFRLAAFERAALDRPRLSPPAIQLHPAAKSVLKDSYFVEFLDLPDNHSEADLHRGLLRRLRDSHRAGEGVLLHRVGISGSSGSPGLRSGSTVFPSRAELPSGH